MGGHGSSFVWSTKIASQHRKAAFVLSGQVGNPETDYDYHFAWVATNAFRSEPIQSLAMGSCLVCCVVMVIFVAKVVPTPESSSSFHV
jgi:hypothetical protein